MTHRNYSRFLHKCHVLWLCCCSCLGKSHNDAAFGHVSAITHLEKLFLQQNLKFGPCPVTLDSHYQAHYDNVPTSSNWGIHLSFTPPSSKTPLRMSTQILVYDERDNCTCISYSGYWSHVGVAEEYKNTTSWTTQKGATARLRFSGTNVRVWGTISNIGNAPISSYSIDDGAEEIYNATKLQFPQFHRSFFQSQQLTHGYHTLIITILTEDPEAYFFLDYIEVTPGVSASSFSPLSSSSSTPSPPSLSPTPSFNITVSCTITPPGYSSKDQVPFGLIIGGTLGGLALLMFTFIGLMFLRRKRKNRSHGRNLTFTNNSSLWASPRITSFQLSPLPDGVHRSEPVRKQPLNPASSPSLPALVAAPQPGLLRPDGLSPRSQPGPSSSLGPTLASTSTHQVSNSTTVVSDLPPPRYNE